jgi:hypothetical protein
MPNNNGPAPLARRKYTGQVRHDYISCRCQVSSRRLLSSPSLSIAPLLCWIDWHTKSPRSPDILEDEGEISFLRQSWYHHHLLLTEPLSVHNKPPHVNGCEPNNQLLSSIAKFRRFSSRVLSSRANNDAHSRCIALWMSNSYSTCPYHSFLTCYFPCIIT